MITTKGITDGANPKPTTPLNWLGHPMKEGDDYFGRRNTEENSPDAPTISVTAPSTRLNSPPLPQRRRKAKQSRAWSLERRKAMSDKIKELCRRKKAITSDNG